MLLLLRTLQFRICSLRGCEVAKTLAVKTFSFGVCSFVRTSPDRSSLNGSTKILNVQIPFGRA